MVLQNIRLLVTDMPACFRFYHDVMGLEVKWGDENSDFASFHTGNGIGLALFGRSWMAEEIGTSNLPAEAPSQDRAALIFQVESLESTVSELSDRGAQFVQGIQSHPEWGIRTAYLRDPAGNLIELNSPMPIDEWTSELQEEARRYGWR